MANKETYSYTMNLSILFFLRTDYTRLSQYITNTNTQNTHIYFKNKAI